MFLFLFFHKTMLPHCVVQQTPFPYLLNSSLPCSFDFISYFLELHYLENEKMKSGPIPWCLVRCNGSWNRYSIHRDRQQGQFHRETEKINRARERGRRRQVHVKECECKENGHSMGSRNHLAASWFLVSGDKITTKDRQQAWGKKKKTMDTRQQWPRRRVLEDTYVKAKATRAPLTTIKSKIFHRSRKYEPWWSTNPRSTICEKER